MSINKSKHEASTLMGEFHARTIHRSLLWGLLNTTLTWIVAAMAIYLAAIVSLVPECSLKCLSDLDLCCNYSNATFLYLIIFAGSSVLVTSYTTRLITKGKLRHAGIATSLMFLTFLIGWYFTSFVFGEWLLLSIVIFFSVFAGYRLSF